MDTIGCAYNFFEYPKRQDALIECIENCLNLNVTKRNKLQNVCPARWVHRHKAVSTFLELQEFIVEALEIFCESRDKDTSSTAYQLLHSVKNIAFQISLLIIFKVFACTLPLSRILQTKTLDLRCAMETAKVVLGEIQELRNNLDAVFKEIFEEVVEFCRKYDILVEIPRICKRATMRCNVPTNDPESHFRIAVFIPFLGFMIDNLNHRFIKHNETLSAFSSILPNSEFDSNCGKNYNYEYLRITLELLR